MIMRITWGKVQAGKWDEYRRAYEAVMLPRSRSIKGLRGRWLAQDRDDPDAGFAVSLWDSMEAIDAYRASPMFENEIQAPLQPFFVGEFRTNHCDVQVVEEFE